MASALDGVRVLDFSAIIAGPWAPTLLSFWGAEVIKVESSVKVDMLRTFVDPITEQRYEMDASPVFGWMAVNKLSIRLNLRKPEGVRIALELAKISDVVLECFTPGTMNKLGLTYDVLRQVRPDVIMLSTSANGQTGPESHGPGYAPLFSAVSGFGSMVGYRDGPPTEVRTSTDMVSAVNSCLAILAALIYRRRTGSGQYIDVSSREAAAGLIGEAFMDYFMNGHVQSRAGNEDDVMAPHNCYRCRGDDKWVSIAIATNDEWLAFCNAIGNPPWTNDPRFGDADRRRQNRLELDRRVEEWTILHSPFQVMDILQQAGVAATPSYSAEDVYHDPHLASRELYRVVEHPKMGPRVMVSPPWRFSETPPAIRRHAPLWGEHEQYVFGELLGMSAKELSGLRDAEVIY